MNCPSCGNTNPDGNRFCTGCGKPLQPANQQKKWTPALIGGAVALVVVIIAIAVIIISGAWFLIEQSSSDEESTPSAITSGQPLPFVTDENFNTLVLASSKPVVVDCFAYWCGPCRLIAPIMEDLNATMSDKVVFLKADVDQVQFVADYDVQAIPTLLLFKNGKVVHKLTGLQSREDIVKAIETYLLQP